MDYGYGTRGAAVFAEYSKSYFFSSLPSKRKCSLYSSLLQSKKPERQNRIFPWKILFTTFNYFFCIWLKSFCCHWTCTHTHPTWISPVLHPVNSHISVGWRRSVKKNYLCLLFPFFHFFFLSCLYKGWMNFQWFCMPVSCLLVVFQWQPQARTACTDIRLAKGARKDNALWGTEAKKSKVAFPTSGRIMSQSWNLR